MLRLHVIRRFKTSHLSALQNRPRFLESSSESLRLASGCGVVGSILPGATGWVWPGSPARDPLQPVIPLSRGGVAAKAGSGASVCCAAGSCVSRQRSALLAWCRKRSRIAVGVGNVTDQLAPILQRPVAGHHRAAGFISPHDDLEQHFPAAPRQLLHPHVVDDQQVRLQVAGQLPVLLSQSVLVEEVAYHVEDRAIEHHEAQLDGLPSDQLGPRSSCRFPAAR